MTKITLPLMMEKGLILRKATPDDTEALVHFNSHVHNDAEFDGAAVEWIGQWTRTLMSGDHPTVTPDDFLVVFDTEKNILASSSMLIPQTWAYEGIEFKVARIELVGTHPDYRKRGLIRKQFEVLHQWCEEREIPVQSITGIPWYYRLFGYEMTLQLHGGRSGTVATIPPLKKDEKENFTFRLATIDDIPFLKSVYDAAAERGPISRPISEKDWIYELTHYAQALGWRRQIIEDQAGEAVGYLAHNSVLWGPRLAISEYEIKPGENWAAPLPAMLRYLKEVGEALEKKEKEDHPGFGVFSFQFGEQHPIYPLRPALYPQIRNPYAWYMRVADIRAFLEHITPVLEARLAASALVGYTREVKMNFYTCGIKLVFEKGKLVKVEDWQPKQSEGEVRFPDLSFLHMLFCHRDFESLDRANADCYASEEIPALLNILFPHKPSMVQALT